MAENQQIKNLTNKRKYDKIIIEKRKGDKKMTNLEIVNEMVKIGYIIPKGVTAESMANSFSKSFLETMLAHLQEWKEG